METHLKKSITIVVFLFFISAIAVLGIIAFKSRSTTSQPPKQRAVSKQERLFHDLGILGASQTNSAVEFRLTDLNGKKTSLSEFRGKIIFLNFWTTWCAACRVEMPAMQKLHTRLKDQNFAMVAINLQESASKVRDFVDRYKLTFTVLLDSQGETGNRFGIRALPTTFILDKSGRIMGQALGAREWNSKKAVALFNLLMGEK